MIASPNSTCQRTFADLDTQAVDVNYEGGQESYRDLEYRHCSPEGLTKANARYFGKTPAGGPPTAEECAQSARSVAVAGSIELKLLHPGDVFCLITDAENLAFLKLVGKPGPEYPGPDLVFELTFWKRT